MEQKRLGDLATYINGYAFKPEDRGNVGLPIIRIQDLTGNAYDLGFYDGEYPDRVEINDGDVLISWSASLGVYVWNRGKALLNQHIFKVIFDKSEINKEYFVYAIQYKLKEMESKTHGATMKHIIKKDFDNTMVPYPSLAQQAKIAIILSKVNAVIDARKQELHLLDDLIKARFVEMFGDLKLSPKWELKRISSVCEEVVDCINKTAPVVDYKTQYKMLRTTNVRNGYVDVENVKYVEQEVFYKWTRRSVPCRGDLLLTREAPVGEVGIISSDDNIFLGQRLVSYRANKDHINATFLMHQIMTQYFKDVLNDVAKGSTVKHIPVPDCTEFLVYVPPIDLQNKFAAFVTQVDKTKAAVQKALDEAQLLFDSMMQQYFG